jgi:hypothetical protein
LRGFDFDLVGVFAPAPALFFNWVPLTSAAGLGESECRVAVASSVIQDILISGNIDRKIMANAQQRSWQSPDDQPEFMLTAAITAAR